ncbi:hypothetical protein NPS58_16995 [Pseudomonas putida]|uniref:hypothetical protein n=1 Tax=Pseudomonas putida TaxID=303 RepID=UPI00236366C7|nr:hypothetical protein [Pseudomonas putida]MDD2059123.1 hypothetical protein [Pseudomonas putida]
MKKRHAYALSPHERLKTWGYLALGAYCISLLPPYLLTLLAPIEGVIALVPLSFSATFGALFIIYNRWLWKLVNSNIPDLNGTWIGCAQPNYQDWPHLAIVTIEQTWTEIYIHEDAFYKTNPNQHWDKNRRLGTNESYAATLEDPAANKSHLDILYTHTGIKKSQPNFKGAWTLTFDIGENHLTGTYFTNRLAKTDTLGSQGPIILKKVSNKILEISKVFECHLERGNEIEQSLVDWHREDG